ncbi:MAG: hypothetical protein WAS21_20455 [Geminicoccaceae bacterium]
MSQDLAEIIRGLKTSADRLEQVFRAATADTALPDHAVAAILGGLACRFGAADPAGTAALFRSFAEQLERKAAKAAN